MATIEANNDKQRVVASRNELIDRMTRAIPGNGFLEVFPGVFLARSSQLTERLHSVFTPAFCVIAQGSKQVLLSDEVFRYDQGHYLISTVELPIVSHVVEASDARPYLSVRIDLDPSLVASAMLEAGAETRQREASVKAMDVSSIDADLLDAVVRLVRLVETPDEMRMLAPLINREIIFRLLRGEQGARLSHLMASGGGDTRRISRALRQLREHMEQPLRI
ncbi:MAG: AraC family transcriptional regulator, partial [Pyrinomonadaceae bacterium]